MADHVAKEMLTIAVISAFIITVLLMAASDTSTINFNEIPETKESLLNQGYNTSIERPASDMVELGGSIPDEIFQIFIIPLLLVIAYITVRAITGNLPFFGG
jgi:hypothetical protein